MESMAIFLGLAFAANKSVSVFKSLFSSDRNTAVTQVIVWMFAIAALLLAASAQVTEHLVLPGMVDPLGNLDLASLVLLGWIAGSTGSVVFDFKKAIDGTDSAAEPRLLTTGGGGE
jgi:hypothetical protein